MAAENFEEHDIENVHDVEDLDYVVVNAENVEDVEYVVVNVENVEEVENVENVENAEHVENVENVENAEHVENVENVENAENMENVENMEGIDNVVNLDNVENVVNVPENSHPAEETQGTDINSEHKEEKKWPGWPGENVFRMLVPAQKVGSIIGRKGEYIKKTCEETKARIKILDGPPGTTERTVMVSAKEEPGLALSPAMDGILTIHKRIIDANTDSANTTPGGTICTRLLVAATQAGSLIGKQGTTINSIQDASSCIIRVLGEEHLPVIALSDDSVIEVQGDPAGVHKAIELIVSHLRKFLVDRSVIGVFETQMQQPKARIPQHMPPSQSWGRPPPPAFPMCGGGPGYGSNSQYMPPPRQYDNYYPPGEMPPMDKLPHQGPPAYGRDLSMGADMTNVQAQQSMVTKVTQNMQIPLSFADALIGTNGSNISYIRRASGATIAVQETRGVPDEMTVEITGSASQVQTAQQLIQNFIADAANNAQNHGGGAPGQAYTPYSSYGSSASNASGHASHPPGSVYGSSYGY